jgi:trigger factor
MQVQTEAVSSVRRRVRFTITGEAVSAAFTSAASKIASAARIPGFRPGKVPTSLVERQFAAEVRRTALDKLLQDHVFKAIERAELRPLDSPEVESLGELKRGEALDVAVVVEVLPEVALPDDLAAELALENVVVDDADLSLALEEKARSRSEWAPVKDGVQPGDQLVVDYTITPAEGEPTSASQFRFVAGDGRAPRGVDEVATGVAVGASAEREIAEVGKVAVTVQEAERMAIPAVDDELAKDLGFDDLAAMKASISTDLARQAEQANTSARREAAIDALARKLPIEVPRASVTSFADRQLRQMFGNMPESQIRKLEPLLRNFRQELMRDGEKALRKSLLAQAVQKRAGIEVSDADVEAFIADEIANAGNQAAAARKHFESAEGKEEARFQVQHRRTLDWLVDQATVQVTGSRPLRDAGRKPEAEVAETVGDAHDHGGHDHHGHDHHDHDHDHSQCDHEH